MTFHLTPQNNNRKLGLGVAVSTSSSDTCPSTCPFKDKGCYARFGPLNIHWKKVDSGERGSNWNEFIAQISKLPNNYMFRYNQAGDLPGIDVKIDHKKLEELADVVKQKELKAWSYTHKPLNRTNTASIKKAIKKGFVINISTETLAQADDAKEKGFPVVVVVPSDSPNTMFTPKGNKVIICPAQNREDSNCSNCQLCMKKDRSVIIGFKAHGTKKKSIDKELKAA
jgi:hypothetical protein